MQTEKEKMLSGQAYKANDAQLVAERTRAKELIFELNSLHPNQALRRLELLQLLLGQTKTNLNIESPFHCDYGHTITIGENFFANYNLVILDCARVSIGDNVFIGPNVCIYTAGHPLHHDLRNLEYEHATPITIGNNVWIGGSVVILPGVSLGNNCVIGAGSVVTKNIPDNVIAVGNPCKVLRPITETDKMNYLNRIRP